MYEYRQTNFFEDLEFQLNPEDFYIPTKNYDFPKFLPVVKISRLKEVYNNYIQQKQSDYWEGLCEHSGSCSPQHCYDVNIYDEGLDLRWQRPSIIIYPVSELLQTNTFIWFNITEYFHTSIFEYPTEDPIEFVNDCGG